MKDKYEVKRITYAECKDWILYKHYLRRKVSATYCYGIFDGDKLKGICTFGNAVPLTMKKSVCGGDWMDIVYELNRLCIEEDMPKNSASFFVSRCLKLLPKPLIVVSYADCGVGHNGYIYQACNFMFSGKSHTQKDWKLRGKEHMHSRTLMDEFPFQKDRINKLKEKYGDQLYQVQRIAKNRYIYFIGSKSDKRAMHKDKRFECQDYPKGDNVRYDASYKPNTQIKLL